MSQGYASKQLVHDCFLERVEFNCTPGARGWGKVLESTKERTKEKVKEKEKEKERASTTTKGEEKEEEEEKEKAEAEDTTKAGRRGYSTKGKCKGYYSYNSGTNVCHYCQKPGTLRSQLQTEAKRHADADSQERAGRG